MQGAKLDQVRTFDRINWAYPTMSIVKTLPPGLNIKTGNLGVLNINNDISSDSAFKSDVIWKNDI